MKTVSNLFEEQFSRMKERGWEVLYVVVDWHDTLMPSTYKLEQREFSYYEDSLKALKMLSDRSDIRLILFTSSYMKDCFYLLEDLYSKGIHIDFVNENPNEANTKTGDFTRKFYYNVLLDDKAGFDPAKDWKEILDFFVGKTPQTC